MIISLGFQCFVGTLKRRINKTSATMPFDWMMSNPGFVYEMLKLLLENDDSYIPSLVEDHFFCCDKRVQPGHKLEIFLSDDDGDVLYNTKYGVLFPHDVYDRETKDKYIRRFKRLKNIIIDSDEQLIFMYASQSSLNKGNLVIDGRHILKNVYVNLSKIYDLLSVYNNNFKMICIDTIRNEKIENLNKNITLYNAKRQTNYEKVLYDVIERINNNDIKIFEE